MRRPVPRVVPLVAALAAALAVASARAAPELLYTESARGGDAGDRLTPQSFVRLAERLVPAVVGIEVRQGGRVGVPGAAPGDRGPAIGTGFIIRKDGYILTNNHVIDRADEIRVRLADERRLAARVVGADALTDVALLKVESPAPLPVAPLGDSDRLRPGEFVVAIGNPFGLEHSVTLGIVSAKGRRGQDIRLREGQPQGFFDFIQTDAAINRGNSGGPLFNLRGEVVGINTAMLGSAQAQAPGIGFSIPINMAKLMLPLLKEHGRVPRSWIGINIQALTPTLAQGFKAPTVEGALVNRVIPTSPAARAGLEAGDVIVEFDGRKVRRADDLRWLASIAGAGRKVGLTALRLGKPVKVALVPLPHPDDRPTAARLPRAAGPAPSALGIEVAALSPTVARRLGLCPVQGVMVSAYEPNAPAVEAGLLRYDLVLRVGEVQVRSLDDYARAVRAAKRGEVLRLLVARYSGSGPGCEDGVSYLWVGFAKR
jgi:serine protease Do